MSHPRGWGLASTSMIGANKISLARPETGGSLDTSRLVKIFGSIQSRSMNSFVMAHKAKELRGYAVY
jgi:hypothetical protein